MEIIFASTGVECVAAPSRGIIYLDPHLDYDSAVEAIRASLPNVHIDAIHHWVERAMPSGIPLSRPLPATGRRRRPSRFKRTLAFLSVLALGAGGMYGGLWAKHRYADNIFARPTFAELASDREWLCDRGHDQTMVAACVTPTGLALFVTALASDHLTVYTITYKIDAAGYTNRLLDFERQVDRQAWVGAANASESDLVHPNLFVGPDWAVYGNDGDRVKTWAEALRT